MPSRTKARSWPRQPRRRLSMVCRSCIAQQIAGARLIANPGCYATSVILALKPLVAAGLVDLEHGIVADSKSGVSGAGKAPTAKTHFMYCGRQSLGLWRVHSSPHRRTAGADRHRRERDHFYAASAADSARDSLHDLRAVHAKPQTRASIAQRLSRFFRRQSDGAALRQERCRRFSTLCAPTTRTSASNLTPAAAAR